MPQTKGFTNIEKCYNTEEWRQGILSDSSFKTPRRCNPNQHVQLISQKSDLNKEPVIPATTFQKLCFYHIYTSSLSKTQMIFREQHEFNKFIWHYIFNVFCKSLQSTYVYMFLSSFAPDYHFFVHKMFPISYGCNFLFIFCAIYELNHMTEYTLYCLDYVVCGLLYKVPWRKCINKTVVLIGLGNHTCCNLTEFKAKFVNKTVHKSRIAYVSSATNEHFNLAHFDYYYERVMVFWPSNKGMFISMTFIAVIWLFIARFDQLKKVYVWKVLSKAHVLLNIMYFLIMFDCIEDYSDSVISDVKVADTNMRKSFIDLDLNMLAESMTAPPVAHVISAKSTKVIQPSRDSAILIISNAINYIFKGILTFLIRKSCEHRVNAPLLFLENVNLDEVFNIWLVYFGTLEYGDIYVVIFFIVCFITEFCTVIISCQCLLEAIVCEWKWIKPYYAALLIILITVLVKFVLYREFSGIGYLFIKSFCTLLEAFILYWMYPLGRLTDDIIFHYGSSLTKFRILGFHIVPFFYSIKMFIMFKHVRLTIFSYGSPEARAIFYLFTIFPIVFGALYAVYYYKVKRGKSWIQLVKPVPEWGPKDKHTRSLRKQFDSRKYITSQAPRELSRHLIGKSRSYNLDIDYDSSQDRPHLLRKISPNYFTEFKKST